MWAIRHSCSHTKLEISPNYSLFFVANPARGGNSCSLQRCGRLLLNTVPRRMPRSPAAGLAVWTGAPTMPIGRPAQCLFLEQEVHCPIGP